MANYYPLDSSVMNTDPFEEQNPIVGITADIEEKLTDYEKVIGHKFTCKGCKFNDLFKKWINYEEVNIEKCERMYSSILKGQYDHFEMKKCDGFQMNDEIILKIKEKDQKIDDPKTFIDEHPRYNLSNGLILIL